MDLFEMNPQARQKVEQACRAEGIDESYAAFVARHLTLPDRHWRWCCGSGCDPCVQALGRTVDRARQALCRASAKLSQDL